MSDRNQRAMQPERVRERIEASRAEIVETLFSLQHRMRVPYDWRGAIRQSPIPSLFGAFTVGFFLARLSSRERD